MTDLLGEFENWCRENQESLRARGLRIKLSAITWSAKPSRYVDIESDKALGRLTVWSSGEGEVQIQPFDTSTERSIGAVALGTRHDIVRELLGVVESVE